MAVIEYNDGTEEECIHVGVHDEWVAADVKGSEHKHYIPMENIRRIVGHESGDDVTIRS